MDIKAIDSVDAGRLLSAPSMSSGCYGVRLKTVEGRCRPLVRCAVIGLAGSADRHTPAGPFSVAQMKTPPHQQAALLFPLMKRGT
jgi:hypothetical protein